MAVPLCYARVKFSYNPQAEDELALEVDAIITVLEQYDDGWWKGQLNGSIGVFPENHVELIEENSQTKTEPLVVGPTACDKALGFVTQTYVGAKLHKRSVSGSGQVSLRSPRRGTN
eukprot:TRINITY_DN2393_c0_g1_i1.p1 TRINITY_DN2393_c0_g1~~TRINITY_DN2393_c0_g1_i1.p1  ORF type:complete len:116 (+),score=19.73 TRINITY_DN2393_c0_g1_i1:60-407(+)